MHALPQDYFTVTRINKRFLFRNVKRALKAGEAVCPWPACRAVEVDYIGGSGLVTPTQDRQGGIGLFVFACHKLIMVDGQSVRNGPSLF